MRVASAAVLLLLTGCSTAVVGSPVAGELGDRDLIAGYFAEFDASARRGSAAQQDFLRRTQHPDFTDRSCELPGVTITVDPAMSTLRPDAKWAPEGAKRPRGAVYVVAVSLTVTKDGQIVGDQIGSERIVVLDGAVYGFMPCLRRS
ncbi:hypothetical protein [Kibdelosporangium phytohabitans]|uniref:Lipoprotein n=1 Tax=Kibdelosporangium phytohabitans TaxID=860235 RepID=A0A0N7F5G4_9PSEU|nr:hypothetical protein [Kibdelosporangium phytohabitans]ALG14159.1 hypothetical protein AOZ06_51345 [Kibdelosporangium phytohabitans]MBE1466853.1 hypothetical protein [Kibdelosporangium phytohabitans]